jgi:sugar phosphate permease
MNDAERAYILKGRENEDASPASPIPWRSVFASRNVWLIGLIMTCVSFAAYLWMFWYPSYLQKGRGVDAMTSGSLSSLVLAGGALGSALGGLLSDYVSRRTGGLRRARSAIGAVSMALAGTFLLISLAGERALEASVLIGLAYFFIMLQTASWWGAVSDISGRHVGALFGFMNALGIFGGVGGQLFPGWMADKKGLQGFSGRAQWDPALYYFGIVLFIGAVAWIFVDSNKSAIGENRNEPCKN